MRHLLLPLCLFFATVLFAQSDGPWTLRRAVDYALTNNLQVRRLENGQENARLQLQQTKNNRLPTVSANSNISYQLGRTVDPTQNTFSTTNILGQNINLQSSLLLYGGGQIKNNIRQAELDLQAAQLDNRVTSNDIALQVANAYLTAVLLREQLTNAERQLELTEEQLENTEALIRAGSVPAGQRYDIQATRANNLRSIVEFQNQRRQALLNLQLLLELDVDPDFDVSTPELEITEEELFAAYNVENVFLAARNTQPTIEAARLREESALVGEELARAGFRPTVSAFVNLSTNYSNLAREAAPGGGETVLIPQEVVFNGQSATLQFPQFVPVLQNVGYFDQLDRNFGQLGGLSLNVPIYSQGRNKTNVAQAEILRRNAALDREQAENQLRNDVELALFDLRAGQESYRAAAVSLEAARNAYEIAERRFRAGAGNSLDLTTASNRLEQAQTELTRAKYQLIFNREVIEFYLGQGLSLE